MVSLVRAVRSGDPTLRRIWRAGGRLLSNTGPDRELADLATAAQAPASTGRRIAVVSVRGGAGKSVVAALLGSLYAARRADPVLAVDAEPGGGSLPWRLGLTDLPTLDAVASRVLTGGGTNLQAIAELLPRTRTGLWVLGGGGPDRPELARDTARGLSRLFPVAVIDCGTGLRSPATAAVVAEAHAIMLVAPATPDGVRSTVEALDRAGPDSRVLVVLNASHRGGRAALRASAARQAFARYAVRVVPMPYDRHVACAAPLEVHRIAEPTLLATSRLAAQVLAVARARW